MSLFNGCSLMVGMELFQLAIFMTIEKCQKPKALRKSRELKLIGIYYCDMSTIHGMQYVPVISQAAGKILWILVILVFLISGLVISISAYREFQENQVIRYFEYSERSITELDYPTITICPIQFNDRWWLQKTLLDTLPMRDTRTGDLLNDPHISDRSIMMKVIIKVTSHMWLRSNLTAKFPIKNSRAMKILLPYLAFNRNREAVLENFVRTIWDNSFEFLEPKTVSEGSWQANRY